MPKTDVCRPRLAALAFTLAAALGAAAEGPRGSPVVRLTPRERGSDLAVERLAFAPDARTLVTASADYRLRVWDVGAGRELGVSSPARFRVHGLAFAPDERSVATLGDAIFRAWDVPSDQTPIQRSELFFVADALAFSADQRFVVSCGSDALICLWNPADGSWICRMPSPEGRVRLATFAPGGRLLATAAADVVRLWDPARGECLHALRFDGTVRAVAFAPDGRSLAAVGSPGLRIWETASGRERVHLPVHGDAVQDLAFAPGGRLLGWAGGDAAVHLWDTLANRKPRPLAGHTAEPRCLAFDPTGRRLAAGGADGVTLLWDVEPPIADTVLTPEDLRDLWDTLGGDAAVAFGAMGRLVRAADQSVPFLAERLRTLRIVDGGRVTALARELDDDRFAVRERATAELARLGPAAVPALRDVVRGDCSAEVRTRIEQILARLKQAPAPAADWIRGLRAVETLERIGTAEARRVLRELGAAGSEAWLAQEARTSAERLERRGRLVR